MLIVFVSIKQIYSRIFYSKNNLPDLNIRLDIRTSNYSHFCRTKKTSIQHILFFDTKDVGSLLINESLIIYDTKHKKFIINY